MTISDWDLRFLGLADHVAGWSKDPSSQVGAVVSQGNRIVSLGFNGFPRHVKDDQEIYADRTRKYRRVIHAEENALLFAHPDAEGCTLYATHAPCAGCTGKAIQSGITRIVCWSPEAGYKERWEEDLAESRIMCEEAGVAVVMVDKGAIG